MARVSCFTLIVSRSPGVRRAYALRTFVRAVYGATAAGEDRHCPMPQAQTSKGSRMARVSCFTLIVSRSPGVRRAYALRTFVRAVYGATAAGEDGNCLPRAHVTDPDLV